MSRVILPESFTKKRQPQTGIQRCNPALQVKGKKWIKAVNTIAMAERTDSTANGFEMDVYFDTARNNFFVYHDSSVISAVTAGDIFSVMDKRNLQAAAWLDCKNLDEQNKARALEQLLFLKNKHALANRILVESSNAAALKIFCDSGFFTSYYVPFFNPYTETEPMLIGRIDSIAAVLKKYPVSALSGYYFQVPFLKKYFPVFPLLTWTEDSRISLVNNYFNYQLEKDDQVKIVLHDVEN